MTFPGAVHERGAELVDINGSTSIFTLCRGCFSALCEKAVFFIKEVLILNKDTKLFPVRRQQTCMNFHFCNIHHVREQNQERYMPRAPPSGHHIKTQREKKLYASLLNNLTAFNKRKKERKLLWQRKKRERGAVPAAEFWG